MVTGLGFHSLTVRYDEMIMKKSSSFRQSSQLERKKYEWIMEWKWKSQLKLQLSSHMMASWPFLLMIERQIVRLSADK